MRQQQIGAAGPILAPQNGEELFQVLCRRKRNPVGPGGNLFDFQALEGLEDDALGFLVGYSGAEDPLEAVDLLPSILTLFHPLQECRIRPLIYPGDATVPGIAQAHWTRVEVRNDGPSLGIDDVFESSTCWLQCFPKDSRVSTVHFSTSHSSILTKMVI
jgi:hypothetical protein